jgi:hypothetical protein
MAVEARGHTATAEATSAAPSATDARRIFHRDYSARLQVALGGGSVRAELLFSLSSNDVRVGYQASF